MHMHAHTNTHQAPNGVFVTVPQRTLIVRPDAVLPIYITHFTLGGTPAAAFHTDIFPNPTSRLKPHSTLKSSAQDNINTKTKCAARMHICCLVHAKVKNHY